jgi:hypothetical protein
MAEDRPERPTLIYDDADVLCRRAVERWKAATDDRVAWCGRSQIEGKFSDEIIEQSETAPTLVLADGEVVTGAKAIVRALHIGGRPTAWFFYRRYVGVSVLVDAIFSFVARARRPLARVARALAGPDERPPSHDLARWLFVRGLGLCALAAFLSVRVQIDALVGSHGILPLSHTLDEVRAWSAQEHAGAFSTFRHFPTLFLVASSDRALHVVAAIGIAASVLLVVDVVPALALALVWICYLSIVTAGEAFFHFQWDALLLEACVVAAFLVPLRLRPRLIDARPPTRAGLFLVRLLVFKLMFLSGVVKLTSKDPTWSSLTALDYHYFTQPIPTWTAWYAHHVPSWMHRASVVVTFVVELVAPFLVFGSRRMRRLAFVLFTLLMIGIGSTGNYGFFNALSWVLCLPLLDDGAFPARVRKWFERARPKTFELPIHVRRVARVVRLSLAALVGALSLTYVVLAFVDHPSEDVPELWLDVMTTAAPFDSVNGYGLFRTMTTERPEIIVEGSDDGVTWKRYELRYKPGDVTRAPPIIGLHMPRLDWELWFAALAKHCTRSPVYLPFVRALLEGSTTVRAELAIDPFPDHPPRYVRSTLWDYTFSSRDERKSTGAWWHARRLGLYCPTLELDDGSLYPVEP